MRSSCTELAIRSALIMSVRGEASELVGFVGFNSPLSVILEAIDKRFGKKSRVTVYSRNFSSSNKTRVRGSSISRVN